MKPAPLIGRLFFAIYLLSYTSLNAFHHQQDADPFPSYVVIGAFAIQQNAVRFTERANKEWNLPAAYEINPNRNLYYVYCLSTPNTGQAIEEAKRLRSQTVLQDSWVYKGILGEGKAHVKSEDINPDTEAPIVVQAVEEKRIVEQMLVIESPPPASIVQSSSPTEIQAPAVQAVQEQTEAIAQTTALVINESKPTDALNGKGFVFKLTRFVDEVPVKGEVNVIDPDKAKKIASFEGNRPVKVPELRNKSNQVTFATEVFGYRKMQRDLSYATPIGDDITQDDAGNYIIPFELVRLQKGDFAIMYNVFFFRDAAVMRPESRYEVGSLVEMLRENPKYKITIHGHTNGNHSGTIKYKEKDSKEFFSLNNLNEGYGSAKELSRARAEEIRDYLIAEGIDPARTSIRAWGGKKAIHDKHSARAQENVRVEIEIVEDK